MPISVLCLDVRFQLRNNSGVHPRSNNNAAFLHELLLRHSCDCDLKMIKSELIKINLIALWWFALGFPFRDFGTGNFPGNLKLLNLLLILSLLLL